MTALVSNPMHRLALVGFAAGFLSVLTFHQASIALVQLLTGAPVAVYATRAYGPLGVPQVLNFAFWGGVWGIAIWWAIGRFGARWPGWAIGLVIGAVGATVVGWFIFGVIKGVDISASFTAARFWRGPLYNAAFGLGVALIAPLVDRRV